MSFKQVCTLALALAALLFLTACGGKPPMRGNVADMETFPQDLTFYAQAAGADRLLMDASTQEAQYERFRQRLFAPWQMKKTSIRTRDISPLFRKAKGYRTGSTRWTQAQWDSMARNAALNNFPSQAQAAITICNTDLREMPTHEHRFSEPTPKVEQNPFDYFQYSRLPIGMPLLIAHTSRDGNWHFVECGLAAGWVDARHVQAVDTSFKVIWSSGPLGAILRDSVPLPEGLTTFGSKAGEPSNIHLAHIGTVLPIRGQDAAGNWRVLVPVRADDGVARIAETSLPATDFAPMPLPMTPTRVAALGNILLGQPYGWGGMLDRRDCSALTRDLLTPFGIWLPRNSAAQARQGEVVSLEGMSPKAKESTILAQGTPFLSLVGMRGHITLYVGQYRGRPALFHNVWGVRVVDGKDDNARFVIGKAVVTSITPGIELRHLYRPTTFADRLRSLNTPAPSSPVAGSTNNGAF